MITDQCFMIVIQVAIRGYFPKKMEMFTFNLLRAMLLKVLNHPGYGYSVLYHQQLGFFEGR